MDIPVDIMNHVIHVVIDETRDSIFTIILSISTLIVAIGTIVGFWKTRESNKLFALEISAKFSPSFDFRDRRIFQVSDQGQMYDFACRMFNTGNVSVSNISIYHYEYPIPTKIDEIIKDQKKIKNNFIEKVESTLEPTRDHGISFAYRRSLNQDTRFVIWIEFEYLQFKAEGIVWLDHFAVGTTGYSWFDNDFIKNKRKELKI